MIPLITALLLGGGLFVAGMLEPRFGTPMAAAGLLLLYALSIVVRLAADTAVGEYHDPHVTVGALRAFTATLPFHEDTPVYVASPDAGMAVGLFIARLNNEIALVIERTDKEE